MAKNIKVFVDDIRQPQTSGWIVVRTVTRAIRLLSKMNVSEVSLDHDIFLDEHLSRETYEPVARFIVALPQEKRPRIVRIHSASEEGSKRLKKILQGHVEVLRRCPPIYGGISLSGHKPLGSANGTTLH